MFIQEIHIGEEIVEITSKTFENLAIANAEGVLDEMTSERLENCLNVQFYKQTKMKWNRFQKATIELSSWLVTKINLNVSRSS